MEQDPRALILKRSEALVARIRTNSADLHRVLPVRAEEVIGVCEGIDLERVARRLREELEPKMAALRDAGRFAGARYEWFYDGQYAEGNEAEGGAAETCELKGPANTDLVDLGPELAIELEEPEMGGQRAGAGGFCIDPVMTPWYAGLSPAFEDFDYTPILNTPVHREYNQARDAFEELFQLRLYRALNLAFAGMASRVPGMIFLARHERWPVLVYHAGSD